MPLQALERTTSRGSPLREVVNAERKAEREAAEAAESPMEIVVEDGIRSVAFVANGEYIMGGDFDGKIRCWEVEDGREVGSLIDAGCTIWDIAVSQDGKWIVACSLWTVMVWDAESRRKVIEFEAHDGLISTVTVSPDATKIATGSEGYSACVWSLSTGQQLLDLQHDFQAVHTIKFSPDGGLLATGSANLFRSDSSLRIYDCQNGHMLIDIQINSESLAWVRNGKQLLALSLDGNAYRLDVSSGTTLSKWLIHGDKPRCISLATNDTFIAASANPLVSFWDTTTHKQIHSFVRRPAALKFMAISANYNLMIGGGEKITLWNLRNILPSPYIDDHKTGETLSETRCKEQLQFLCTPNECSTDEGSVNLGNPVRGEHPASERMDDPDEIIRSLRVDDLRAEEITLDELEKIFDTKLANSQRASNEDEGMLEETIRSLRADISTQHTKSEKLEKTIQQLIRTLTSADDSFQQLRAQLADSQRRADSLTKLFHVYQQKHQCETLFADDRTIIDAATCFSQLMKLVGEDEKADTIIMDWLSDFRRRCIERLEKLAGDALRTQIYHEAAEHYSAILSLDPSDRLDMLAKRSETREKMELWEAALEDADEVIKLDPSSYRGYERRHAALHGAGRHLEAVAAFDVMLSKIEESPDEHVRNHRSRYTDARPTIRDSIATVISHMPHVLIDTITGQLLDKTSQAKAFEELPIFYTLVSSMTTHIDSERIEREVKIFYRYVMLSHKWQPNEPCYEDVKNIAVYKLTKNIKLQKFCFLVRSLGFHWAWSDTCCIDRKDHSVLQEALVAMFVWYRGSSLTIVYLHDVPSKSLWESVWNTRAWTYQEYVAAKIVRFYTKDWEPYLELTLWNHKESPIVIAEMERASRVPAEQMAVLLPGHERAREKLFLASLRQSTRVEDIAYALLGIFNVPLVPMYGEGYRAVGRFLEHILTASGDVTVLAWTGIANDYNSCLPINLTVYNSVVPPHIPHIRSPELDRIVTESRTSTVDLSLATTLYERLNKLPLASLTSTRLHLPCIRFHVTKTARSSPPILELNIRRYRMTTTAFGDVEIKASQLDTKKEHCLVHPWIRPLLDQDFPHGGAGLDVTTQALRLIARLRQPFGALLFEKVSPVVYRRVAADSLIMVQIREEVSLTSLIDGIDTLYVK